MKSQYKQTAQADKRRVEVAVIVVNYGSPQAVQLLLEDLTQQAKLSCVLKVLVADNGPDVFALAPLISKYRDTPNVQFQAMPGNLGYFGAAHFSLNSAWKGVIPDWLIVSNADIRMLQPDFCSRLAQLDSEKHAVIAPRIVSGRTGLDQNPFHTRRPSAFRINLNRIIPRVPLLFWLMQTQSSVRRSIRRRYEHRRTQPATETPNIYAPHGSFIIFSREYFRRGGSLACGSFLFAEELFVAEVCRRLGLGVTYVPTLEVLHDEHVSMSASPAVRRFQAESADYCAREFFAGLSWFRTFRSLFQWLSQSSQ